MWEISSGSIDFYTRLLGMSFLRTAEFPADEFSLTFLGYGPEATTTVLELTYNYGKEKYNHGEAYGHVAISFDDVHAEVARLKAANVEVTYESTDGFMAFIHDPDGYEIELLNEQMFLGIATKGLPAKAA